MDKKVILKAENITKYFPGVKALDGVSLEVKEGEVVALLGENGAGKSTLIKIFAGVQGQDSGNIVFEGKEVKFNTPMDAKKAGISVVYQELANVPQLTVAENLFINQYGAKNHILNWKEMYSEAKAMVADVGLNIDVHKLIVNCNVAEKQQIEIARALYEKAKLIILDEPTSALNDTEIERLLENIIELKKRGIGIILITHKMDEIFRVADEVVILRDGVSIDQKNIKDTNEEELITLMVGRELGNMYPPKDNKPGEVILKADNLNNTFVKDVSFELRKGEILGIYGLMGSGHQELGQTLFGCMPKTTGILTLEGKELKLVSPKKCIEEGLAFVPSDRKVEGLVQSQSVAGNLMTASYEKKDAKKLVNYKHEREVSRRWIKDLLIKTRDESTIVETLSGGNQQKVILAKWLEISPKIIILNEPTRGIDVGAKAEIYKLLNNMCKQGISIIMVTSEMPELLAMSNRAIVMFENKIQRILSEEELTENNVMTAAIGGVV